MGLFDTLFPKRAPAPKKDAPVPKLAGGRISSDGWRDGWLSGTKAIVEPDDYESEWRILELDSDTLDKVPVNTLLDMLSSVSPDVSRAVWDFERMCNPGWEYKAYNDDPEGPENTQGQAALDDFFDRLGEKHKAIDVLLNRLFMGAYFRGAFCAELVLDRDRRTPVDIATPDPSSIRFRKVDDPLMKTIYIPGQWQGTNFIDFRRPTFAYVPIDPMPGSPYGRAPAAPALFSALFTMGMLHDLRRVIAQQGYPRIDIEINLEKLVSAMPSDLEGDPDAFMEWVNAVVQDVKSVYANLEPDDAYVHTDTIAINRPVGTVDADSLGSIGEIIRALERMSIRALKTMPLLMGINESSTETHAARQWEVYSQGIRAFQHLAENMLEHLLKLALRAQGIQCDVQFRFAEMRASEELRDEQVRALKIANTKEEYAQGWIDQEEASMKVTGKPPAEDEPRKQEMEPQTALEAANDTVDDSEGKDESKDGDSGPKAAKDTEKRMIPEGANEPLADVGEVGVSDADVDRAIARWDAIMGKYDGLLEAE